MWPFSQISANKKSIEDLKKQLAKKELLSGAVPGSTLKDGKTYQQDATSFLKECFDAGIDPPKGYCYYYTSPSIMHGFKDVNLAGSYFYTDKNVPFLYVRGENGSLTGFPIVDVTDVKETDGTGVIVMQHFSEHLNNATIQARIISGFPQVVEGGFKGVVWDGKTKFDTDYDNGTHKDCGSHYCTIEIFTKRLKVAVESIRTNGSLGMHKKISIVDQGSVRVLELDKSGNNDDIFVQMQGMYSMTESEKDQASILLKSDNNRLNIGYVDFKGKKHGQYNVYLPFYVIEDLGQGNVFNVEPKRLKNNVEK